MPGVLSPNRKITDQGAMWQVVIHLVFVFSAIALAWTDKLMMSNVKAQPAAGH